MKLHALVLLVASVFAKDRLVADMPEALKEEALAIHFGKVPPPRQVLTSSFENHLFLIPTVGFDYRLILDSVHTNSEYWNAAETKRVRNAIFKTSARPYVGIDCANVFDACDCHIKVTKSDVSKPLTSKLCKVNKDSAKQNADGNCILKAEPTLVFSKRKESCTVSNERRDSISSDENESIISGMSGMTGLSDASSASGVSFTSGGSAHSKKVRKELSLIPETLDSTRHNSLDPTGLTFYKSEEEFPSIKVRENSVESDHGSKVTKDMYVKDIQLESYTPDVDVADTAERRKQQKIAAFEARFGKTYDKPLPPHPVKHHEVENSIKHDEDENAIQHPKFHPVINPTLRVVHDSN